MRFTRVSVVLGVIVLTGVFATVAYALNIKDTSPPRGQVGVAYSFTFEMDAGSGTPPIKWSITSGSLPPGLSLSDEGTVSGTPTQAGTFNFYVQAQDSQCCPFFTQELRSITITSRMFITTNSLPDAAINQPYSQQLTANEGASGWTVVSGTLPDGISVSSTGLVSGTPTKAGAFSFRVQATGSNNTDTKDLSIFVLAPLDLTLAGGVPPKAEPVPLNGKVNTPFTWDVDAVGGKPGYTFSSTTLPVGLTLDPATGTVSGTPTVAGVTQLTMTVTDSTGAKDTLRASLNVKALLAFSPTARPRSGKVGRTYSWKLPVTGASKVKIFLASGSFPPGLSINEETGVISGTPLTSGSFKVKVWVLGDPGTQISKTYSIKIAK